MALRTTTLRNLGSEFPKLPDLTDSATRKRLSVAAIEAFLDISDKWGLRSHDARLLLGGISSGRYYGLKKNRKGLLTQDELTRVSLLIGIFKALNTLFSEKLANQWVVAAEQQPDVQEPTPSCVPDPGRNAGHVGGPSITR